MTPGHVRARIAAAGTAVTGTGAAASLALALLVLVCAFVAVAMPRARLGYPTAVLQRNSTPRPPRRPRSWPMRPSAA